MCEESRGLETCAYELFDEKGYGTKRSADGDVNRGDSGEITNSSSNESKQLLGKGVGEYLKCI